MNKALKLLVLLPAILFVVIGLRWLVAPAGIAPDFGLTLQEGIGLSTQIGDLSSFFLTLGICMLIALTSQRRIWFYPPMILLGITALGRIIAWLFHDATLTVDLILVELVLTLILIVASSRLPLED
jgi:hypothetical protein